MFRYIALAWDDASPPRSAAALRLSKSLQAHAPWQPTLLEPGLHVFTAGARPRANGSYRLLPYRGVVLGKLFRRGEIVGPGSTDLQLTEPEIDRVCGALAGLGV